MRRLIQNLLDFQIQFFFFNSQVFLSFSLCLTAISTPESYTIVVFELTYSARLQILLLTIQIQHFWLLIFSFDKSRLSHFLRNLKLELICRFLSIKDEFAKQKQSAAAAEAHATSFTAHLKMNRGLLMGSVNL